MRSPSAIDLGCAERSRCVENHAVFVFHQRSGPDHYTVKVARQPCSSSSPPQTSHTRQVSFGVLSHRSAITNTNNTPISLCDHPKNKQGKHHTSHVVGSWIRPKPIRQTRIGKETYRKTTFIVVSDRCCG